MNNCTTPPALCLLRFILLALGLCLFAAARLSAADSRELYGEDYFRSGQSWADAGPRSIPVRNTETGDDDEALYVQQLQETELSGGPYSDALAEPLSSLGHYYRNQGNYGEALGLYQRALHVVRVNDGLYSERQLPLVRALLDTYRDAGDFQALDERYAYFFRLYGNGQPPFTDLRMRANLEFLRWQREAFRVKLDGDRTDRLLEMYGINERILESADLSPTVSLDWYRQLVLSQIRNLYLLQSEIELFDPDYARLANTVVQPHQGQELGGAQQRLQTIRRSSAATGRSLLEALVNRAEGATGATAQAAAYLELGDWHHWNGRSRSARGAYVRVIELLDNTGDSQLLEQWLGSPVELPANGAFWQPDSPANAVRRVALSALYDVSATGKARNIRVEAASVEDEAFASRLRRKLSKTLFRPRFVAGDAEAVADVSRNYELLVD